MASPVVDEAASAEYRTCLQVRQGSVLLGTWQSAILAEFDGPRNRSVAVQVSGV